MNLLTKLKLTYFRWCRNCTIDDIRDINNELPHLNKRAVEFARRDLRELRDDLARIDEKIFRLLSQ